MFTAFVLLCAQNYCFAVGGPAYVSENECIADFMQNGVPSLQMKYPTYTITQVKCYEWEKQEVLMPYSKYSPKQKKLAAVAPPRKKITGADLKKLSKSKKRKK